MMPPQPSSQRVRKRSKPMTSEDMRGGLQIVNSLGLSGIPGTAEGVAVAGGVAWRAARVDLRVAYAGNLDRTIGQNMSVRFHQITTAVRGCGFPTIKQIVEIPMCAILEPGVVIGEPTGFRFLHGPKPWLALATSVGLVFRPRKWLPRVGFSIAAEP